MAANANFVIQCGNVVADPQLSYTTTGTPVVNFRIAVNTKFKGGERTLFIDCTAFGPVAEIIAQYGNKGKNIMVTGELAQDEWTSKQGEKRVKHYILVNQYKSLSYDKTEEAPTPTKAPENF